MELVDGPTVADLLTSGGPLPVPQVVDIAEQVCGALAAAHVAGVIHRDIKPGNLIVGRSGVVKVCDFGIAHLRTRDASAALTGPSEAVGTCEYMAPEQANGDPIDARTDLYALGCVLYAMLAGHPPFLDQTAIAVMHQHLHRQPASVRSVRPDVPAELDDLIGRLLAKRAQDRPNTATEVRARLAVVRANLDTSRPPAVAAAVAGVAASTAVLARPSGRHRMSLAGPGSSPRWPAAQAWLAQWWLSVVAAALVLATAVTVTVVVTGRDPAGRPVLPAAGPAPAAGAAPPAEPTPAVESPAPATVAPSTREPTPPRRSPATAIDRLAALAGTVQEQVARGNLAADAGRDLVRQLGEAAVAVQAGKVGKGVKKLREVDRRLAELRRDGKLTAAGFAALDVIEPIIATIR
jgi:serine/threonine-protein kinase